MCPVLKSEAPLGSIGSSFYEMVVTGNLEAARTSYKAWAQSYPCDDEPPTNLGAICALTGSPGNLERRSGESPT